jgi:hypothetical protein
MDDGGDVNPDIDEAGFVFDTVTFDADLSNGVIDIVTGGATRIGGAGIRVNNIGLQLIDVEGALSFSDLDIATEGELGLDVFGAGPTPAGFELDILAGDIDALDGQALYLENATLDVTLSSVTSTNAFGCCFSTGDGIALINLAGSFEVTGTTTVTGAQANGILIEDSAASIAFGTTDVAMSGGPGKSGIDFAGTNTSVTFGTTTVSGIGESQTGIDFSNSATTAAFGLTTISSPTGSGGSIGIDLSGTLGNRTITFAQGSDIDNLNVGVQLGTAGRGGATANATFIFGDGDAVDGLESFITATAGDYTVDTIGLDPASGSYDFDDVDFTGDANLLVAPDSATFVSQSGGQFTAGGALGLSQTIDTISLADADALTAAGTVFAFVGPINLAAAGFDLDAGQSITGFGNGNIVSFGTIQPANVFGDLGATGAAVTGNETTIIGTDTLFTLAGGNEIRHTTFDLSSGVVGSAVFAASTIAAGNDITIEGVTIAGVGQGRIAFDLTDIASDVFIQNNDISIAGTLLDVSGGSGDVTVTRGTLPNGGPAGALSAGRVIVGARLAGSAVTFTDQLTLSSGAADAVLLTGNTGAAVSFAGLGITTTAGRGFVATGDGTVNVSGSGNTIATTTGTALVLSGVTAGITLDSVTAGGGANGISIVNVDNSAISITGDVSIDDATSAGIFVQNSDNTTFTVGGLTTIVNDLGLGTVAHGADLQTNAGSTFNFNGVVDIFVDGANAFGFRAQSSGTVNILDPNGTNEITSQNGTALLINPTTVNITLANLTAGGGLNGVFLDQMSGSLTVTGTVTVGRRRPAHCGLVRCRQLQQHRHERRRRLRHRALQQHRRHNHQRRLDRRHQRCSGSRRRSHRRQRQCHYRRRHHQDNRLQCRGGVQPHGRDSQLRRRYQRDRRRGQRHIGQFQQRRHDHLQRRENAEHRRQHGSRALQQYRRNDQLQRRRARHRHHHRRRVQRHRRRHGGGSGHGQQHRLGERSRAECAGHVHRRERLDVPEDRGGQRDGGRRSGKRHRIEQHRHHGRHSWRADRHGYRNHQRQRRHHPEHRHPWRFDHQREGNLPQQHDPDQCQHDRRHVARSRHFRLECRHLFERRHRSCA